MKIAVIGASGNLGSRIVKQALERNMDVTGFTYHGECLEDIKVIRKNAFDIEKEDIVDVDVIFSAFGGGFKNDPKINHEIFLKYISLLEMSGKRLIAIGGAGSLYQDASHTKREYEAEGYSPVLAAISKNICEGIGEIRNRNDLHWTIVCPSKVFDANGAHSGNYEISEKEELIFNAKGESVVSYDDLAQAMLDIAENNTYDQKVITVLSK